MKVAIVTWDLSISGGEQRQDLELASYLVNKGHTVKIYCAYLNKENCYPDLMKKLDIHSLYNRNYAQVRNLLKRFFYSSLEPLFLKEAKKIANLMDRDFDIVNCHGNYMYRIGYIYKKNYRIPVVWMMNDLPGNLKIPKINRNIKSLFKFLLFLIQGRVIGRYFDRSYIAKTDRIVVLDKMNRDLIEEAVGLDAKIIRSGLDIKSFKFQKRNFGPKKKTFKILATGIFFSHRRFEDLIIALDILRKEKYDMKLNLIGSDAYNKAYGKKIRNLVSRLNLEGYVNFLGAVSEEELIRNYSTSDVFVFPNYPQTWGLAVFEAMACGTPVIVSTGCGASEVLTSGEDALLISPKKPEEIAACLRQLFNNKKLREKLGINGRKFVEENIKWDLYGEKMLHLFKKVIDVFKADTEVDPKNLDNPLRYCKLTKKGVQLWGKFTRGIRQLLGQRQLWRQ